MRVQPHLEGHGEDAGLPPPPLDAASARAHPDLKYEVEVINSREGYVVSPEDPYVLEARDIVREVTGRTLPFTGTLASTDMNYQVNEGGMPCFNLGVGGPYSNGHKQDESASIDEIVDCTKIAALIYMRKLKTSG